MPTTLEIPLARIGNSRGVRLPAPLIKKHGFDNGILLVDQGDSVVLKPKSPSRRKKLSWNETALEMAAASESWSDWETTSGDGLEEIPWR